MLTQLFFQQKPVLIENSTFWFEIPHPTNPAQHLQVATHAHPSTLTSIFHSQNHNTLRTAKVHHFDTDLEATNFIENFLKN